MPFLEIVGFTSTWKNYTVAGAFLSSETEKNYSWAVDQLRQLCGIAEVNPTCIVTDREKALMNPLDCMFPSAMHILCRRHIQKNIEARAKLLLRDKKQATLFTNACLGLFSQTTIHGYESELQRLTTTWRQRPELLEYLRSQWLDPYKTRIVSAWVDTVLSFGCHTSNRF